MNHSISPRFNPFFLKHSITIHEREREREIEKGCTHLTWEFPPSLKSSRSHCFLWQFNFVFFFQCLLLFLLLLCQFHWPKREDYKEPKTGGGWFRHPSRAVIHRTPYKTETPLYRFATLTLSCCKSWSSFKFANRLRNWLRNFLCICISSSIEFSRVKVPGQADECRLPHRVPSCPLT